MTRSLQLTTAKFTTASLQVTFQYDDAIFDYCGQLPSCDKNPDWEQNEKMINKLDSLDDAQLHWLHGIFKYHGSRSSKSACSYRLSKEEK